MKLDAGVAVACAFGAVVGSFLNVVIHRLPREESLAFPASHCPHCHARIRARDNVPVVGYLLLRGRCRDCGARIGCRYPLVEALTAALAAGLWVFFGGTVQAAVYFTLAAGLVAVTFIDLDHMIIPDSLSLGGVAVGLLASFVTPLGWKASLLGAAVGGGSLLAVYLAYYAVTRREGLGLGDVKLLAAIGAFLGWQAVLFTLFTASVTGAVVGGASVGFRLRQAVPFGAFLAFGAMLYVFWGPALIQWYLGTVS
ncbi:MAG: prepilin peptidase [Deltaproteobacteria bacterium]|nr:prepilin peptidase [Deltaproteobacteria bacterium]